MRRRFFVEESWPKDGYKVARVSFIDDLPIGPTEHTTAMEDDPVWERLTNFEKSSLAMQSEDQLAACMQTAVKDWLVRKQTKKQTADCDF